MGSWKKTQLRACLTDLAAFVERHVEILRDPLFGNIQDPACAPGTETHLKTQPGNQVRGNIVAKTVKSMKL